MQLTCGLQRSRAWRSSHASPAIFLADRALVTGKPKYRRAMTQFLRRHDRRFYLWPFAGKGWRKRKVRTSELPYGTALNVNGTKTNLRQGYHTWGIWRVVGHPGFGEEKGGARGGGTERDEGVLWNSPKRIVEYSDKIQKWSNEQVKNICGPAICFTRSPNLHHQMCNVTRNNLSKHTRCTSMKCEFQTTDGAPEQFVPSLVVSKVVSSTQDKEKD